MVGAMGPCESCRGSTAGGEERRQRGRYRIFSPALVVSRCSRETTNREYWMGVRVKPFSGLTRECAPCYGRRTVASAAAAEVVVVPAALAAVAAAAATPASAAATVRIVAAVAAATAAAAAAASVPTAATATVSAAASISSSAASESAAAAAARGAPAEVFLLVGASRVLLDQVGQILRHLGTGMLG